MPTEPLTDDLRRSLARGAPTLEQCDAVIRLLDELERLRKRDREQAAGEEVLRQQLRDAERKIEMLRAGRG